MPRSVAPEGEKSHLDDSRLVVIAEDTVDVDIQERELLRATLTVALTDATVLRALQRYQTQARA